MHAVGRFHFFDDAVNKMNLSDNVFKSECISSDTVQYIFIPRLLLGYKHFSCFGDDETYRAVRHIECEAHIENPSRIYIEVYRRAVNYNLSLLTS